MEGENNRQAFQPIDLREVVGSKNKQLAKRLPGFMYRWLGKILHINQINDFLREAGHLKGIPFINEVINNLNIKFEIHGEENIPREGRYMFVSNHPLGGLDGVILLKLLNEKGGPTRVIINDFLMAITPLADWFVPVNKIGGQARDSIGAVEELYQSDDHVLIFPAGLCSRKIDGKIVDLQWQKHFIQKAVKHQLDIVPIYFEGRNTNKFYNLAKIRKILNIKFNIEMMYLVDELYKHQNKAFKIHFGQAISYKTFNRRVRPIEWADRVKSFVYRLPVTKDGRFFEVD